MFIPYSRHSLTGNELEAIKQVLDSGLLTQGDQLAEFEKEFSNFVRSKFTTGVSSGSMALQTAYASLGVGSNTDIITTSLTFAATANSALNLGGEVCFTDINPETLDMDADSLQQTLHEYYHYSESTLPTHKDRKHKLMLCTPVHFAGYPSPLEEISKICRRWNIDVVEDAAHALGSEFNPAIKVGSQKYSRITCFSFHPAKLITTGEGGAICTNDEQLYKYHQIYRHQGLDKTSIHPQVIQPGTNCKITEFQAAVGRIQLKKAEYFLKKRKKTAQRYLHALQDSNLIKLPCDHPGHSWHIFVIRVPAEVRDKITIKLRENGIGASVHYLPVHLHPYYQNRYGKINLPHTEKVWKQLITLPLYPTLDENEQDEIIALLENISKKI
ncbi:MAG: DegT/DnrJ/EryC1/StrS family aminotransferase [bacterium]